MSSCDDRASVLARFARNVRADARYARKREVGGRNPYLGHRNESQAAPSSGTEGLSVVIAIFGPTASGKTAVADAVARLVPAEAVSADSMQAYRGLPILTNQPSSPTRLVGVWPLAHEGSVAEYALLAHAAVDEVLVAGRTPVVAGGTGLYLRAALTDLRLPPAPLPGARERSQRLYDQLGPAAAHAALAAKDRDAATRIHANDRRRVVRALELAEAGQSLHPARNQLWTEETRRPALVVGLHVPQDVLERRIAERTSTMFERGVEQEVARALAGPISATARETIGLREVAELPRLQATEAIELRTRRYAAYQRKWMRRIAGIVMLDADRPPADIAGDIVTRAGQAAA